MHIIDRPLLLGLIALERELISPTELIDAFRWWRRQPESSLGRILAERGNLSNECLESLEKVVADSFEANTREPNSAGAGPTRTWQHNTALLAADAELTTSFRSSRRSRQPGADTVNDAFPVLRYQPLRLHAMGGLGQVFVADDLELHRQVALKEIRDSAADDAVSRRRFIAEAEITGKLEHPGIVPVYGLGIYPDGRPFYAMRFIQGETLAAAIKEFHQDAKCDFASLQFRQLLARAVSVCNAVGFAHSRGIVHRDLKPQNVMLGPFGETLVVDWGLAKPLKGAAAVPSGDAGYVHSASGSLTDADFATSLGEIVGTPAYMSPEQAGGRLNDIGPASDVYGLGAILYVLLTGQPPLSGNIAEICSAIQRHQFPHPRQIKPQVPRALAAICLKAMSAQPSDRYASALDLAADIDRWLAGEAASAYAEPWTDTAFRWVRKHRLPVAVATALLFAVSIALAIGNVLIRKERDVAQTERQNAVVANDRAQQNASALRQIVERFLIRIGDDRLSSVPGFETVRLEMADLAAKHYRDLLQQQPEELSLLGDAATTLWRSANLYRMVGSYEPAARLYDESIMRLKGVQARSRIPKYDQALCETMCDRALLVSRRQGPKAAIGPMRDAFEAGKKLVAEQPRSVPGQVAAARAEGNLADLLLNVGQYDEAIRLATSSAATKQRAADANPQSLVYRLSAALAGVSLGQALREAGRTADARQSLDQARQRVNDYLRQEPNEPNLRYIAARCAHELAQSYLDERDLDKASENIAQALAALHQLTEEFSKVVSYRRKLAEVLTANANVQVARGELESADQVARRAIDLLDRLDNERESADVPEPLTLALVLAGEIEFERSDMAAARDNVARASDSLARALSINPESPKLAAASRRLKTLNSALTP